MVSTSKILPYIAALTFSATALAQSKPTAASVLLVNDPVITQRCDSLFTANVRDIVHKLTSPSTAYTLRVIQEDNDCHASYLFTVRSRAYAELPDTLQVFTDHGSIIAITNSHPSDPQEGFLNLRSTAAQRVISTLGVRNIPHRLFERTSFEARRHVRDTPAVSAGYQYNDRTGVFSGWSFDQENKPFQQLADHMRQIINTENQHYQRPALK